MKFFGIPGRWKGEVLRRPGRVIPASLAVLIALSSVGSQTAATGRESLRIEPPEVAFGSTEPAEELRVERGRLLFRIHCASCHGEDARGHGPMVEVLEVAPADLTILSRENAGAFPMDDTYHSIDGRREVAGHGSRRMPVWGWSFQEPGRDAEQEDEVKNRILDLISYLESVQQGSTEEVEVPDPRKGGTHD